MSGDGQLMVWFSGELQLSRDDIDDAGGSIEQAVQNEVGPAGVSVVGLMLVREVDDV